MYNIISKIGVLRTNRHSMLITKPAKLSTSVTQLNLTAFIDSTQMPGIALASNDGAPRFGYGIVETNPYAAILNDLNASVMIDNEMRNHEYFLEWMNLIVNTKAKGQTSLGTAYEVGYKDDYTTTIVINVTDDSGNNIRTCTLYRAFPKFVGELNFSYSDANNIARMPVTFAYTDFEYSTTRMATASATANNTVTSNNSGTWA